MRAPNQGWENREDFGKQFGFGQPEARTRASQVKRESKRVPS